MKGKQKKDSKILNHTSIKKMTCRQVKRRVKSIEGEKIKQGIFWYTSKGELGVPRKMIGHNGGDYGIFTMMFFDPKKDRGYILLSNTEKTEVNANSMIYIYQSLYKFSKKMKN